MMLAGEGAKSPSNIGFGKKLVQWSKTQGVDADNGAIFFMNPQDGPSNNKKGHARLPAPHQLVGVGQPWMWPGALTVRARAWAAVAAQRV